jgi:hypothetical protein
MVINIQAKIMEDRAFKMTAKHTETVPLFSIMYTTVIMTRYLEYKFTGPKQNCNILDDTKYCFSNKNFLRREIFGNEGPNIHANSTADL